ncbi:sulfatase-like hydrolase/transferase [Persicobacter diffluens]|uniref:N-acetylgalactosamine-6-sulfatase n=1 Tax=Persicobacter diffluens TaxID=981 RepID=A0AAN4VZL6_9BACT|nr:N-acetylgalactosamine-6-sulfatase [Persicobacter diffluens]
MLLLKRLFHFFILALLLSSCAGRVDNPPNVIVILADDLGWAGLSSYGGMGIESPELDALAENGVKCNQFYAASSVCTPTRVALLTGRYQQRVGLDHIYYYCERDKGLDPAENPLIQKAFKAAGYTTGIFGKWHLGSGEKYLPSSAGFDEFTGFLDGNIDFISKHNTESEVDWYEHHQPVDREGYVTHLLNDAVADFIEENKDQPFFAYIPHAAVHVPMQGPDDPALRTDDFYAYRADGKMDSTDYMRRYTQMVKAMDEGVGQMMETLRKHDLEENTLIIFTSDNGGERIGMRQGRVNGPFRGHKELLYEGGIRVPAIFYWKGKLQAGLTNDTPMFIQDLFPTICEAVNMPYPEKWKSDGQSFWSNLAEDKPAEARDMVWMHREKMAFRRGDMKLLRLRNKQVELYNMKTDPFEKHNLANDPAYANLVEELIQAGDDWQKEVATGYPGSREIGVYEDIDWPCKRDLEAFNSRAK